MFAPESRKQYIARTPHTPRARDRSHGTGTGEMRAKHTSHTNAPAIGVTRSDPLRRGACRCVSVRQPAVAMGPPCAKGSKDPDGNHQTPS
jgi:hypothetical protein